MQLEKILGRLAAFFLEHVQEAPLGVELGRGPKLPQLIGEDAMSAHFCPTTPLAHTSSYEWCHPLSDIIGSLLNPGLHLDFLQTVGGGIAWREIDPRGISTIDS